MKIRWKTFNRSLHKWLSILIGLQVLFWFLSGFVMTMLHIDDVHGDHLVKHEAPKDFSLKGLASLSTLPLVDPVSSVRMVHREGQPIYLVSVGKESKAFDAITGRVLAPLSGEDVVRIAHSLLAQPVSPSAVTLLTAPTREYSAETPVWKLDYAEPETFSLYISPLTGQVRTVRNFRWRVFDFFWMLHIMDYSNRENFNTPLVRGLSGLALVLTATGFYLAWQGIRRKRGNA